MNTVTSADGTPIAYDDVGEGRPVILVGGAFSYRRYPRNVELATLLARDFRVISYDRRGRGDSGDNRGTRSYAVEREIEDLAALIDATGSPECSVWGQSSGGVLALRAAAAGLAIRRLAIFEPPFRLDQQGGALPPDFAERLAGMVDEGKRGQAVAYFMTKGMGAPAPVISLMRLARPLWSRLTSVAHTLPYDVAVLGETIESRPLADTPWSSVRIPTLVLSGAKSPARTRAAGEAIVEKLPAASHQVLAGQSYNIKMKPLAPVLADFFGSQQSLPPGTDKKGAVQ